MLPCLPVLWRQTFSLFGILSLARSQLAYARRVLFLANDHTGTRTRRNSLAFPPSSSPPDTDRQTCYRINFIPTRYHRRPPIPYSHLSSLSLPSTLSFHPSVPYRRIQSARSNQSFNPNNAAVAAPRRNGLILLIHGNAGGGGGGSKGLQRERVKFLISAAGQPRNEGRKEETKSASIIADL